MFFSKKKKEANSGLPDLPQMRARQTPGFQQRIMPSREYMEDEETHPLPSFPDSPHNNVGR